jgi:hypothetical protein
MRFTFAFFASMSAIAIFHELASGFVSVLPTIRPEPHRFGCLMTTQPECW